MNQYINNFSTPQEAANALGDKIAVLISEADKEINIAISGGSTPKILFTYMAEHHKSIPWTRLHIYWVDERCVLPTDDDSNFKMTKETLLDNIAIPEKNVHRILAENFAMMEAIRYSEMVEENLPSINDLPYFDIVLLGMGDDGHTASIFPNQMELIDSNNLFDIGTHPTLGQARISMTGGIIKNAGEIIFLVTGDNKKEVLKQIFNDEEDADEYPAYHFACIEGKSIWYTDSSATALL